MFRFLCLLAILGLGGLGCGSSENMTIDNPLPTEIQVSIDGESHKIAANSHLNIPLSKGKHHFETKAGGKIIHSGDFEFDTEGVLNATRHTYIRWKDIYSKDEYSGVGAIKDDSVFLNGNWFYGDFVKYDSNQAFIEKKWDYDLFTPFPDTIDIPQEKGYAVKTKIFRKSNFIEDYNKLYAFDSTAFNQYLDSLMKVMQENGDSMDLHEGHNH